MLLDEGDAAEEIAHQDERGDPGETATALNSVNLPKFIWPVPAMNGANMRKNGMKRVMTIVRPPYFAKK